MVKFYDWVLNIIGAVMIVNVTYKSGHTQSFIVPEEIYVHEFHELARRDDDLIVGIKFV